MTRSIRITSATTVATALLFASAGPADATTPDPRNITADAVVVGNSSGTPICGVPAGYDVVVRDPNRQPVAGAAVLLDFAPSAMKLCATQGGGTTLNCAAKTLTRLTDSAGAVNFAPRLAGFDNTSAIDVVVSGVVIARVRGRSTDLDAADGTTGLGDFAIFADNFLAHPDAIETDFDLDGSTGLGDLVLFAGEFRRGTTNAYCP